MTFYRSTPLVDYQFNPSAQLHAAICRRTGFNPRPYARKERGVVDYEFSNSQKVFAKIQRASGVKPFLPVRGTEDEALIRIDQPYGLTKKPF